MKISMKLWAWIFGLVETLLSVCASCDRILFLTIDPMGSPSHKIFYTGIAEALAIRNHNITMVSSHRTRKSQANIREIVLSPIQPRALSSSVFNIFGNELLLADIFFSSPSVCADTLGSDEIQALKKEKFDLIIISFYYNFCYLSLVDHFKVPFIYTCFTELISPYSDIMGNIDVPSTVPHIILEFTHPNSFFQRLQSVAFSSFFSIMFLFYLEPKMHSVCQERKLCPPDMPSLADISSNASMAIVNSIRTLENPPRPMMPNIIYAGGIHIKPAKPLPKDLEEWVAGSGPNGFIYFSTGSCLQPSSLPDKYRRIIIKVFSQLKQRVLWKWDKNHIEDVPLNVRLGKWFPQQDILGHKKLKLFISHGGLMSTQEALYNAVPLLGMPVFADQFSNMRQVEMGGLGRVLRWSDLTEDALHTIILDILNNDTMKETSKRRSALMRDTPHTPKEEVSFWVEYVLRHKGAPHLRSPLRTMQWYLIYNVDVWLFIAICLLVFLCILGTVLKRLLQTVLGLFTRSQNTQPMK